MLALIGFVGLALLVGVTSGFAAEEDAHVWYRSLTPPPATPSDAAFSAVWAVLYVLIGIAAWRIWHAAPRPGASAALRLWGWQLFLNAAWLSVFFGLHAIGAALLACLLLLALVVTTAAAFARRDRITGMLFAPYPLWVAYAAWLNAGFWWLNARPFL